MHRRGFLRAALSPVLADSLRAARKRAPKILLRSSWQVVNIGDIAHTPGVLALLERYIPDAQVRLWPSSVANGVDEILRRRFPSLMILSGPDEVSRAFAECDFLLHGSGASLVAANDVARWRTETRKPYGIYGITFQQSQATTEVLQLLTDARFVFFRDSVSLELAKSRGATSPVMAFGPDGAFATDLKNDGAAGDFLRANRLEPGRFLCCIPRFRLTPGWLMSTRKQPYNGERDSRNQAMKEHDHAPLRAAITAVVRETGKRVLICPEDETQVALGKEMLYNPLPPDVKAATVWRDRFWLTDEAVSTYVRSAGLFGNEMHSPIMCIGNGVPAIVCRFDEQTSKGFMWRDIGLGDWLFDLDREADIEKIVPAVVAMAKDPARARRKAAKARRVVQARQRETMRVLRHELDAV